MAVGGHFAQNVVIERVNNKLTMNLMSKVFMKKTPLSKCTGNAGTCGGKIYPTGANIFRGHWPHNQFSVNSLTWHAQDCTLKRVFQFVKPCSAGDSHHPTYNTYLQ